MRRQNLALHGTDMGFIIVDMWYKDYLGQFPHVFLNVETLKGFLEDVRIPDLDGIRDFLYAAGVQSAM